MNAYLQFGYVPSNLCQCFRLENVVLISVDCEALLISEVEAIIHSELGVCYIYIYIQYVCMGSLRRFIVA